MATSRSPEAVNKLLDISRTGGINIGSAEDRAEDVGGIIHAEHIQLYVSIQTLPSASVVVLLNTSACPSPLCRTAFLIELWPSAAVPVKRSTLLSTKKASMKINVPCMGLSLAHALKMSMHAC